MFDLDSFILGICLLLFIQLLTAIINDCFQSALLKRAHRKDLKSHLES